MAAALSTNRSADTGGHSGSAPPCSSSILDRAKSVNDTALGHPARRRPAPPGRHGTAAARRPDRWPGRPARRRRSSTSSCPGSSTRHGSKILPMLTHPGAVLASIRLRAPMRSRSAPRSASLSPSRRMAPPPMRPSGNVPILFSMLPSVVAARASSASTSLEMHAGRQGSAALLEVADSRNVMNESGLHLVYQPVVNSREARRSLAREALAALGPTRPADRWSPIVVHLPDRRGTA